MPPLVRFLLIHAAIGFAIAFVFVGFVLAFDLNGLRTLIWASDMTGLALFMLTFFTGLTFASVQIGVAVMLLGEDEHGGDRSRSTGGGMWVRIWHRVRMWLSVPPKRTAIPIRKSGA